MLFVYVCMYIYACTYVWTEGFLCKFAITLIYKDGNMSTYKRICIYICRYCNIDLYVNIYHIHIYIYLYL